VAPVGAAEVAVASTAKEAGEVAARETEEVAAREVAVALAFHRRLKMSTPRIAYTYCHYLLCIRWYNRIRSLLPKCQQDSRHHSRTIHTHETQ
jgi:hypothetical protein